MRPCIRRTSIAVLMIATSLLIAANARSQEEQVSQSARVIIGAQAPPFSLTTIDDETMSLVSLRGKTPLVLIFFRGAW